jgi:hypothetical protein
MVRRLAGAVGHRQVVLDFSSTARMFPTGTLYLTAELDRLKRIWKSRFNVRLVFSENPIVNQVLFQVGIGALCGHDSVEEDQFDESVRHWRYATGERMNDAPGRALERFEGRLSDELASGMWKGVSEAVVNSVQHAYLAPRQAGPERLRETRWWMFSHVRDNRLTVAVCDLGIGIPRSLPIVWGEGRIRKLLEAFGVLKPDLAAIRAALQIGATRTGQSNRGKGLPQIWQEMKEHGAAFVGLLSNRGLLTWDGTKQIEKAVEFDESMFGTMIFWTVPLDGDQDGRRYEDD